MAALQRCLLFRVWKCALTSGEGRLGRSTSGPSAARLAVHSGACVCVWSLFSARVQMSQFRIQVSSEWRVQCSAVRVGEGGLSLHSNGQRNASGDALLAVSETKTSTNSGDQTIVNS